MNIAKSNTEGNFTEREQNYLYALNCFIRTISHMTDISEINQRLYVITINLRNLNIHSFKPEHITEEVYRSINRAFKETTDVSKKLKNGLFIDFDVEGSRSDKWVSVQSSDNKHFHGLIAVSKSVFENHTSDEIRTKILNSIYDRESKKSNCIRKIHIEQIEQDKPFISYVEYSSKYSKSYTDQVLSFSTKCYPYDLPVSKSKSKKKSKSTYQDEAKNKKTRFAKDKARLILDTESSVFTSDYQPIFFKYHEENNKFLSHPANDNNLKKQIDKYISHLFT